MAGLRNQALSWLMHSICWEMPLFTGFHFMSFDCIPYGKVVAGFIKGIIMGVFAISVLFGAMYRALDPVVPEATTMGIVWWHGSCRKLDLRSFIIRIQRHRHQYAFGMVMFA